MSKIKRSKQQKVFTTNIESKTSDTIDIKTQKKIVNNRYLNKLREESEGLPELRVC